MLTAAGGRVNILGANLRIDARGAGGAEIERTDAMGDVLRCRHFYGPDLNVNNDRDTAQSVLFRWQSPAVESPSTSVGGGGAGDREPNGRTF